MVDETKAAPPNVTKLPLSDQQRARARSRASRRGLRPATAKTLAGLGQATGFAGIPRGYYIGAAIGSAVYGALLRPRHDMVDWLPAAVLIALGIL
jgi:hypothetical protein